MEWLYQKMNLKQILYISVAGMSPCEISRNIITPKWQHLS